MKGFIRFLSGLIVLLLIFAADHSTAQASRTHKAAQAEKSTRFQKIGPSFRGCFGAHPPEDTTFDALKAIILKNHFDTLPIGESIAAIGKLLLEKPYIEKSLEVTSDESQTVCNLLGFDCVTFFETSWALAITMKKYEVPTFADYIDEVTNHRYRNGIRKGFDSRLHYTSDYFYDNARRGNLKEMTKIIGRKDAKREKKEINFMTQHPSSYAQLQNDMLMFVKMDSVEKQIARRGGFYYIPKEDVEDNEEGIQTGDLIGITTSIAGIDCSHTGIAIREKDGRVHFMHASSAMHKVIISPMPLAEYLEGNHKQTGIMVYRPLEPK
ncbi:MAG: DUF1460 domain-containing protein [Bacteroidota bacterium]|nr:DUF1460 domain-containing protein [Bacteroidota bacterium]